MGIFLVGVKKTRKKNFGLNTSLMQNLLHNLGHQDKKTLRKW